MGLPHPTWKRDKPEYARGMAYIGIKFEKSLDPSEVLVGFLESYAVLLKRKGVWLRVEDTELVFEEFGHSILALKGTEVPGERKHITPKDAINEQVDNGWYILETNYFDELGKPVMDDGLCIEVWVNCATQIVESRKDA